MNERNRCQAQPPGKWCLKQSLGANTLLKSCNPKAASTGQRRRGIESQAKSRWYFTRLVMASQNICWLLGQRQYHEESLRELPSSVHQRKEREGSNS